MSEYVKIQPLPWQGARNVSFAYTGADVVESTYKWPVFAKEGPSNFIKNNSFCPTGLLCVFRVFCPA